MPGKFCAVEGCKSSTKLPREEQPNHFFSFPSDYNEDWRRVVNKCDVSWLPKKSSRICSLHFTKGDIVGNRLRVGAIPIPAPFLPIIQGIQKVLNTIYKQGVSKLLHARHHIVCLTGTFSGIFKGARISDSQTVNLHPILLDLF